MSAAVELPRPCLPAPAAKTPTAQGTMATASVPQQPTSWAVWMGHKVAEAFEHKAHSQVGWVPRAQLAEPSVAHAAGHWLASVGRKSLAAAAATRLPPQQEPGNP